MNAPGTEPAVALLATLVALVALVGLCVTLGLTVGTWLAWTALFATAGAVSVALGRRHFDRVSIERERARQAESWNGPEV